MKKRKKEKFRKIDINVDNIKNDEIDQYIKKYVKLKRVNIAKCVIIAASPVIIFGSIAGLIYSNVANVNSDVYEKESYSVHYADKNGDTVLKEKLEKSELDDEQIIIKTPWVPFNDDIYNRQIYQLSSKDDLADNPDKAQELVNIYTQVIEDYSLTDYFGNKSNKDSEIVITEYNKNPNLDDNKTEVSILYNKPDGVKHLKKSVERKKEEFIMTIVSSGLGALVGEIIGGKALSKPIIDSYEKYEDANSIVKKLKRRKKNMKQN